eukprot:SAG22_NODE_12983_length_423_cov_0.574074_1_plen_60_part_01
MHGRDVSPTMSSQPGSAVIANLRRRYPQCSDAAIAAALSKAKGHAGQAGRLLRKASNGRA